MEHPILIPAQTKTCLECGIRISGRSDKKFCADSCRIAYNNRLTGTDTNLVRNINNALRRNRKILLELNPKGTVKVGIDELQELGFDFRYFTHEVTLRGHSFRFCYEQGYTKLNADSCWLVAEHKRHSARKRFNANKNMR
jgi:hypothetical protein